MPRGWAPSKVDKAQPAIVEGLRKLGGKVLHLHGVGKSAPDLAVCFEHGYYAFATVLLEVKSHKIQHGSRGGTSEHAQRAKDQVAWHDNWPAPSCIVHDLEEAVDYCLNGKSPKRALFNERITNV